MTMSLNDIQTGSKLTPPRACVYGPHGTGKTTLAANAPNPIFICTEEGLGRLDVARFPLVETLEDFESALETIHKEAHDFKTLVLDSLDWLEPIIWQRVCEDNGKRNIEDIPYGGGYRIALKIWKSIMSKLDKIWKERGMIIILIAHSEVTRFEDPAVAAYDRYQPKLHKKASAVVSEWVDAILFANFAATPTTDKLTGKVKAVGKGVRQMHTEERPAYVAKNRHNLPHTLPMDWNEFIKAYKGENNA